MKLPKTYYNPISLLGSIISSVCGLIIVFFMIANRLFDIGGSVYIGIFIYIVLPVFLIIGLILIPIGMSRRSKRIKREGEESTELWIKIDLKGFEALECHSHFYWRNHSFSFIDRDRKL